MIRFALRAAGLLAMVLATGSLGLVETGVAAPAPGQAAAELSEAIDRLGDFDYEARTRAAQTVRRASPGLAVPALAEAVAAHDDGYVRYRALVLLAGFNDAGTSDIARGLLDDPNDRVRSVAYAYFEYAPDPTVTQTLLEAIEQEQSEFVRPAVVRALASRGNDAEVRRALVREVDRGEDFFRSTVIEALGDYAGGYALDALMRVAGQTGPLQDDALLAIGKIGDRAAVGALTSAQQDAPRALRSSISAASCLLGIECGLHVDYLAETLRFAAGQEAYQAELRSICAGLGALAASGHPAALGALLDVGPGAPERARAPIALALGTAALRNPTFVVLTLGARADRTDGLQLLVEAFDMFQEDFEEERFYATVRQRYWAADAGSPEQALAEEIITRLEF